MPGARERDDRAGRQPRRRPVGRCWSARSILAINFAPVPEQGHAGRSASRRSRVAAGIAFVIRQQRRAEPALRPRRRGRRDLLGRRVAGIIVFGSLMGAMFIGQQFLQNVLGYSTLEAGRGDPAGGRAAWCWSRRARPSSSRRRARASRCSSATCSACSASSRCSLLWKEGSPYWQVGLGYAFIGVGVGLRRHAGVALADRLGAGAARGHGVGHRRPAARPRRRDHAVDLRRAADGGLRGRVRDGHRGVAGQATDHATASQSELDEVVRRARAASRQQYPQYASQITAAAQAVVRRRQTWAYTAGIVAVMLGAVARVLHVPEAREELALLAEYARRGPRLCGGSRVGLRHAWAIQPIEGRGSPDIGSGAPIWSWEAQSMTTSEGRRLHEAREGVAWRAWGPYLSERQWGTVREDYSDNGDAWSLLQPRPGPVAGLPVGRGRHRRASATTSSACASRSRCGTGAIRSSRSGCSASPTPRATTART